MRVHTLKEAVKAAIANKPNVVILLYSLKTDSREFKEKVESGLEIKAVSLRVGEVRDS